MEKEACIKEKGRKTKKKRKEIFQKIVSKNNINMWHVKEKTGKRELRIFSAEGYLSTKENPTSRKKSLAKFCFKFIL